MKIRIVLTVLLLLLIGLPALAFDLATTITKTGNTVRLVSAGYAKLSLLKKKTSLTGSIVSKGNLSIEGTANIIMWSKVEGRYYFSKIPALQNIRNKKNINFEIPFNTGNKEVTEVIIEVEMLSEGNLSISGLSVQNG